MLYITLETDCVVLHVTPLIVERQHAFVKSHLRQHYAGFVWFSVKKAKPA